MNKRIGISFLSFGKDIFAGIEHSLYNLALGLLSHGVEVFIYSGYLSGADANIGDLKIHRSTLLPASIPDGDQTVRQVLGQHRPQIVAEIQRFLSDNQITHLYVCDPLWGIVQATSAWKDITQPVILSLQVVNTQDLLDEAGRIPYHLYTAVSDSLRDQICERARLDPLTVIPNSIDISRYSPRIGECIEITDAPVLFCNARISPEKGILYLVRSFPRILKIFPKAELWLCGGVFPFEDRNSYLAMLYGAIHDLGVEKNVRVLSNLAWDEIPDVIRKVTIVVIPSLQETFGLAALEALACGKPLVVTDAGNLPNLVQDAGLVVKASSEESLADGIIKVLENHDLQMAYRLRGPVIARAYSNELVAGRLLDAIGSV